MTKYPVNSTLYIITTIHASFNIAELSVIIFLCYQWTKPTSLFQSAYFVILNIGYTVDFIFSIGWIYGHLSGYPTSNPLQPVMLFFEWQAQFGIGIWEAVLGFNRCMSLAWPFLYSKFWNKYSVICSVLFINVLPFIIDFHSFTDPLCKFWYFYEPQCEKFRAQSIASQAVVSISFGLLSLSLILFGIWKSPRIISTQSEKVRMEQRLVLQSAFSSTMITLTFMANCVFIYYQIDELFLFAYVFYIIEFYPPIFVLFYASATFRKEFFRFYRISKISVPVSRHQAIAPWSAPTSS